MAPKPKTSEQRAEEAERKRKQREKKRQEDAASISSITDDVNPEELKSEMSSSTLVTNDDNFDDVKSEISEPAKKPLRLMTVDEKREYDRIRKRVSRANKKLLPTPSIIATEKKPSLRLMTDDERREYNRLKQRALRAKRKLNEDDGITNPHQAKNIKEATPEPTKKPTKNCRIRVGLLPNFFDVETDAIVIPIYEGHNNADRSSLHEQMKTKFSKKAPNSYMNFRQKWNSSEWEDKIVNYGATEFDWEEEVEAGNRIIRKKTIHVQPPSVKNDNFTLVTEAHLRASYLSCLLQADQEDCQSVAFPILGNGVCRKRSVAIALQTFFAYMSAVENTHLQLVYILTQNDDHYDDIGDFLCYIREFNLRYWSLDTFFGYENIIYSKIKSDVYFATIPGTDMVWRSIKLSQKNRKVEENNNKLREIHEKMMLLTGVSSNGFENYKISTYKNRVLSRQFIKNGATEQPTSDPVYLDIRLELDNFCGSNQVLRKLWIISYYQMYFQDNSSAVLDFTSGSVQLKLRERTFKQQKWLHAHLINAWNHTLNNAPYKCKCTKVDGYHEKMSVFCTKMSHYDQTFDEWILSDDRSLSITLDDDDLFAGDLQDYLLQFVYGKSKTTASKNKNKRQELENERVSDWMADKNQLLPKRKETLFKVVDDISVSEIFVGKEVSTESYNAMKFDQEIDDGIHNEQRWKLLDALTEAQNDVNIASTSKKTKTKQYDAAMASLNNCKIELQINRYEMHLSQDLTMERTIRNRLFRTFGPSEIHNRYEAYLDDDVENQEEEDVKIWVLEKDSNGKETRVCTICHYLTEKVAALGLSPIDVSKDVTCYQPATNTTNLIAPPTSTNVASTSSDFPEPIDLGTRTEPCPHCGALAFPSEELWSCCKNGAVWIPPLKRLPKPILQIFAKRYRPFLISSNAAFSMASIRYQRQNQAWRGVNSMKIKGIVSFHPSAVHPTNPTDPRYANFIVLEHDNKTIAGKRFSSVPSGKNRKKPEDLKKIFYSIQKFMNKNNRLYEAYKNMRELEKEYLEANQLGNYLNNNMMRFRIVPPLSSNGDVVKNLKAHPGVYARQSRIAGGYITVAYTCNPEDASAIPRGLVIWPRNPKSSPRQPLSIYSDLCDQMSYPLFFPDAIGGWGLHKYARWTEKGPRPSYIRRIKDHIREIEEAGESPHDYYDIDQFDDLDIDKKNDSTNGTTSPIQNQKDQDLESDSDDEGIEEEDPNNLSDDQIILQGALEDLQTVPLDDEIGQQPNIKVVEKNGDVYPAIDRNQKTIDIPLVFGNPFGAQNVEDEEPIRDRFDDGTDNYDYVRFEGDQVIDCRNLHEEEEPIRNRYDDGTDNYENANFGDDNKSDSNYDSEPSKSSEDECFNFTGAGNIGKDFDAPGEDEELAAEHIFVNEDQNQEENDDDDIIEEDVCFGDEHNEDPLALGRNNDGIRVKNVGQRQNASIAEYTNFIIKDRKGIPSRFQGRAQTLGQLHLIDLACRMIESRMNALTVKRAEFGRMANRSHVWKCYRSLVTKHLKGLKKLGMLVTMPSTVPGTSKYQRELVMSAVKISNSIGSPHLFFTFTGNPKWPEIERECKRLNCEWADIPEFVNTVFNTKFRMLLEDIAGKKVKKSSKKGKFVRQPGIFGPIKWYNYSVEFQQRGMPHVHMLVSLENAVTNAAQVDDIISAEVPDFPTDKTDPEYEEKLRYYNLVKNLMTHFPCKNDPEAYCNLEKKKYWKQCCKGFPKNYCKHTVLSDNQYPDYKRTDKNKFELRRNNGLYTAGSEYVVAHNKYLLMKYQCHLNVEIVSSIKTMKYMFKYIHKGADRVLLEVSESIRRGTFAGDCMTLRGNLFAPANLDTEVLLQRQKKVDRDMQTAGVDVPKDERIALNDCTYMMDMSAMTACEAAWRVAGLPMHGSSHIVLRGYIHEEGKEPIYFKRGLDQAKAKQLLERRPKTMMTAWFEANQNPVQIPESELFAGKKMTTDLTLPEMLSFFKFDAKKQEFVLRKKDYSRHILGRIQAPQPRFLELTAVRLLSETVTGPKCWEDLRTFRGTVYDTCLQAARARGLMNGDIEWDNALSEVAKTEHPIECRRFFASILIHCAPANPKELWEKHWNELVNNTRIWTESQKKAHALRHIQFLLARHGMELSDFELGDVYNEKDVPALDASDDIDNPDVVFLDPAEHKKKAEEMYQKLNTEQKTFVDRALEMDKEVNKKKTMFVDGPGGTGKTFCYTTIYHYLKSRGRNVICVSHTGIAACLLPNGCTAHRKFSIPLEVNDLLMSNMRFESKEGQALMNVNCVIWDEVCMTDHRIIAVVDRLFRDLTNIDLPFGGVQMIMGGDWRQILPIVDGVHGHDVIKYTLKNSYLWADIEKFRLVQNQRAISDPEYSQKILDIGDGNNYADKERQMVHIKLDNVIKGNDDTQLAKWVFPDVNDIEATKTAALLTIDNKTALRLNDYVLNQMDGELHEFRSVDTPDKQNGLSADPAVFASETPSGMPPHNLKLKIGAQVILLRNLSVEQGLCNGTRLTVQQFGDDIIYCTINNRMSNSPHRVFLHRILMTPTGKGIKSCGFSRLQYPIRLAYASTINKSQGQTLSRCGLVLHTPVFSHGQLYVAMSRVQKSADFKVWHTQRKYNNDDNQVNGILIRNVVYKTILSDRPIKEILESIDPTDTYKTAPIASATHDDSDIENATMHSAAGTDSDKDSNKSSQSKTKKTISKFLKNVQNNVTAQISKVLPKKKKQPQQPILNNQDPMDIPYLTLDRTGIDCFMNTIVNMVFSCAGLRRKYINCRDDPNKPLGSILGRIFRRETTSVKEWRLTLADKRLHVGQQDISEVFGLLINKLADEDGDGIMFQWTSTKECRSCHTQNSRAGLKNFIELTMPRRNSFKNVFNAAYGNKKLKSKCTTCNKMNVYKSETVEVYGSYLFATVHHDITNFTNFPADSEVEMFGNKWKLRAFSEYDGTGTSGHYTSQVRWQDEWFHVNEEKCDGRSKNLNLNSHCATILVFEKC